MTHSSFDCDRTCPLFELIDWCRFNPVLNAIGPHVVNSHTVTVKVEFKDPRAFEAAVTAIGGTWIGQGDHALFQNYGAAVTGLGFSLPGWRYPLVLKEKGELAFDDFNGQWGNVADVDRLKAAYAVESARIAAENQGWFVESQPDGSIVVHHPAGGTMTVDATGKIDADGFHGHGCHEATHTLAEAMGTVADSVAKPEFYEQQQQIHLSEGR